MPEARSRTTCAIWASTRAVIAAKRLGMSWICARSLRLASMIRCRWGALASFALRVCSSMGLLEHGSCDRATMTLDELLMRGQTACLRMQGGAHLLQPLRTIGRMCVRRLFARFGKIELADEHGKPRCPDEHFVLALHDSSIATKILDAF